MSFPLPSFLSSFAKMALDQANILLFNEFTHNFSPTPQPRIHHNFLIIHVDGVMTLMNPIWKLYIYN